MIGQDISDYLYEIQTQGRYAISLHELRERFGPNEKAIAQKLYRLKKENKLAQVRKEFYVIVPPQYFHQGILPTTYFLDDMMKFLKRDYYLGLYSAAALHGAGHQQPMQSQIIIQKPALRDIKTKNQHLSFFTKSSWNNDWLVKKKTEAGYVLVSSPELTAIDIVHYHKQIGGLNRVVLVLEELSENLKSSKLMAAAKDSSFPTIQRLGYLLEQIGETRLAAGLLTVLDSDKTNTAPLSLSHKNKSGFKNEQWNLIINAEIELS
ncbi:type IV toxin-antitoxin system AbiEi family antitoxin [Maribacter polysiphoniae]|uniref:Putative transcriptional regulator of viral defense system n=1 Tax=Maribacter polysiphoniae TaxID=429344 RepID=A0A316E959_9FLAO|nr:type IV toxin-antitoxin system AbiEi family antitoxin [Maribacter polysiphoniae]MBD1259819.1 type IV toxin-antitoxin system AbiEi family antitoxin [Maribacter polysiphoniae]PWK25273.1 putative transcriptional regulator of viral defense system [Maribacter polysiphoniae]